MKNIFATSVSVKGYCNAGTAINHTPD